MDEAMNRDERQQLKDLHTMKPKRAPFFNGWMMWTCSILLLISLTAGIAAVNDRDMVTLSTLCGVVVLVFAARSYQYFIQRR